MLFVSLLGVSFARSPRQYTNVDVGVHGYWHAWALACLDIDFGCVAFPFTGDHANTCDNSNTVEHLEHMEHA